MMTFYLGADDDDRLARADERADIEDEIAARRADEAKDQVRGCDGMNYSLFYDELFKKAGDYRRGVVCKRPPRFGDRVRWLGRRPNEYEYAYCDTFHEAVEYVFGGRS